MTTETFEPVDVRLATRADLLRHIDVLYGYLLAAVLTIICLVAGLVAAIIYILKAR